MSGFSSGITNRKATPAVIADAAASRPASAPVGTLFIATDTKVLQRWTGAAWVDIGPSLAGFVPTSRTLTIAGTAQDLSANRTWDVAFNSITGLPNTIGGYGIVNGYTQLGNSFAATAVLGTNDAFGLQLITNNVTRYSISSAGVHTITGNTTITGTATVNTTGQTSITAIGAGSSGIATAKIVAQNAGGSQVSFGIIDNNQVIALSLGATIFLRIANTGITGTNFASVASTQTILNWAGAIANTAGTSIGLSFTLTGSDSQNGYHGFYLNVIDTEVFTAGNRNIALWQFNSADRFALTKAGNLTIAGTMVTAQPSASGRGAWKLGKVLAGAVALDAANYVEVDIDGVVVKLLKAS